MTAHTQKAAANEDTGAVAQASDGQNSQGIPTVEEARKFTEAAEIRLLELMIKSGRAQWVQETFITHDTEQIAADADQQVKAAVSELAAQSRRYDGMKLPEDVARKCILTALENCVLRIARGECACATQDFFLFVLKLEFPHS